MCVSLFNLQGRQAEQRDTATERERGQGKLLPSVAFQLTQHKTCLYLVVVVVTVVMRIRNEHTHVARIEGTLMHRSWARTNVNLEKDPLRRRLLWPHLTSVHRNSVSNVQLQLQLQLGPGSQPHAAARPQKS